MPIALIILFGLLGLAPAALFVDGSLVFGAWSTALSVALVIAAIAVRPREAAYLGNLVRPLAMGAMIPVIVMLIQATPLLVLGRFANPIWESAGATLGQPLTPSLSIDTGATMLALCRYLAWLGVGLLACIVTLDRQRAERVMVVASAVAVLVAALLIANDALRLNWFDPVHTTSRGAALDAAILGLILSMACADRVYERFESRRANNPRSGARLLGNLGLCAIGIVVCVAAIVLADPRNALFAAAVGLALFISIVVIRRAGFGFGGAFTVAVLAALLIVAFFSGEPNHQQLDLAIKYSAQFPSKAITGRMLADNAFAGSGAGSYPDLVPIYRGLEDSAGALEPPTAAAKVTLEFGRPILWIGVLGVLAMTAALLRAALRRGRDSFYPAAGASVLVALLISAFGNSGLFGSPIVILTGAVIGLAFAQSRSRTVR